MNSKSRKYTNIRLKVMHLPASFSRLPEDVCCELERRLNISYFAQLHASKLKDLDEKCIQSKIVSVPDVQLAYRALEGSGLFGLCILLDKSGSQYNIEGSVLLCVAMTRRPELSLFYVLCFGDSADSVQVPNHSGNNTN